MDCGEWECGVTGHGFAALQLLGGPRIVEPEPEEEESAAAAPVGRVTVNGAVYDVEVGAGGSDGGDAAVAALRRMVLKRGGVFARMSPEGKKAVVDCMGQGCVYRFYDRSVFYTYYLKVLVLCVCAYILIEM